MRYDGDIGFSPANKIGREDEQRLRLRQKDSGKRLVLVIAYCTHIQPGFTERNVAGQNFNIFAKNWRMK
jgi:hypothetical protein